MPLSPGHRLGPYEIIASAGAGGMGEIYRAKDTRLDRTVAIKVLPSHVASDPERRQRFEREARAISSLSHPHIGALYDIGQQDGLDFLVLEYLEGETLEHRLERGPLAPDQVVRFALEIAGALDRAHRQGLIHRDLKPANIMLTKSGAKLLDFGLAKMQGSAAAAGGFSMMATEGRNLTAEGTILGTFQYMAPEQLEGKEADARTDLFAFGAVVHEMATGKKAFEGKSQASLISAIMSSEPNPISTIQPMAPPALDRLIKVCLAKDPEARWQTAHDVMLQLQWIVEGGSQAGIPAPDQGRARNRERMWMAVAATCFVAMLVLGGWLTTHSQSGMESIRLSLVRPSGAPYATFYSARISPDGKKIVFVGRDAEGKSMLYLRALDSSEARPLAGTDGGTVPFWSPDSQHLGFFADGKLKKMDVTGGPSQIVCDAPTGQNGSWSREGIIIFGDGLREGIYQVPAAGGAPSPVTRKGPREEAHLDPWFLPDGRHFVFLGDASTTEDHHLKVGSLDSRESTDFLGAISNVEFVPPGYLLYVRGGSLLAHRFDPSQLRLSGDPVVIAKNLVESSSQGHQFEFSASETGRLLYRSTEPTSQLVWVDRAGKRLESVGERNRVGSFALSPDGRWVSFELIDEDGRIGETRLLDLGRGTSSRLTFHAGSDRGALVYSPDSRQVVFTSARSGASELYLKPVANPGEETLLIKWPEPMQGVDASAWSPDGRSILLTALSENGLDDIWVLPLDASPKPHPLIQSPFNEGMAVFSPDGRWIAYVSDESGRNEVYLRSFADASLRYPVSTKGGHVPRWRSDGKEIFFVAPGAKAMSAEVRLAGTSLTVGTPVVLFDLPGQGFVPSRDGQRFLVDARSEDPDSAPYTAVLNWTRDLQKP